MYSGNLIGSKAEDSFSGEMLHLSAGSYRHARKLLRRTIAWNHWAEIKGCFAPVGDLGGPRISNRCWAAFVRASFCCDDAAGGAWNGNRGRRANGETNGGASNRSSDARRVATRDAARRAEAPDSRTGSRTEGATQADHAGDR